MKRLSLYDRTEVLPALHRRGVTPAAEVPAPRHELRFRQRTTRVSRFPVEESLARNAPEPPWRGRYVDVEV